MDTLISTWLPAGVIVSPSDDGTGTDVLAVCLVTVAVLLVVGLGWRAYDSYRNR